MGNTLRKLRDKSQPFSCEICMEPMLLASKKFKNQNRCIHPFCIDCIVKYISFKVEDNVVEIRCPSLNCNNFLDPIFCRNLVGPELFVKWSDKLCESYVLGLTHCYCPNKNCSILILDECGGNAKQSQCPNCKRFFCFQCKLPWHAGFKCEERRELMDKNDVAFVVLAQRNKWKRCPRCRIFVSRIQGCQFIVCRCGATFCYNCGRQLASWALRCDCNVPSYSIIITCRLVLLFSFVAFLYTLPFKNILLDVCTTERNTA
ncbi:hypothetical protein T459_01383, partial [Capsicum annuum]